MDRLGNLSVDRHPSQRQPAVEQKTPDLPMASINSQTGLALSIPSKPLIYTFIPPPPPPPLPSNRHGHTQSPLVPPPPPLSPRSPLRAHTRANSTPISPVPVHPSGSTSSSLTSPLHTRLSTDSSGNLPSPQPTNPNLHPHPPSPSLPSSPPTPSMPSIHQTYNLHPYSFPVHSYPSQTPLHSQPTQFQSQFPSQTRQNVTTAGIPAGTPSPPLPPTPPRRPNSSSSYSPSSLPLTGKPLPIPDPSTRLSFQAYPITASQLGNLITTAHSMTTLPVLSRPPALISVDQRTPSPFELGPFPATSIPKHFVPTPPPPPRPPKPPELAVPSDDIQTVGLSSRDTHASGTTTPRRRRDGTSPKRDEGPKGARASISFNSTSIPGDSGVRVSDATNSIIYERSDQISSRRRPWQDNDGCPENEFSDGERGMRISSIGPDGVADASFDTSGSAESGHSIYQTVEGGPDEDVRSDEGETMESYNPAAYDFPRNVNDAMVQVLSAAQSPPTNGTQPATANDTQISHAQATITTYDNDSTPIIPEPISNNAVIGDQGFIILPTADGEAPPPTYDQVASEMDHERERGREGDRVDAERRISVSDIGSRVRSLPGAALIRATPSLPIDLIGTSGRPRIDISRPPSPVTFSHPSILNSPPTSSSHNLPKPNRRSMIRRFTMSSYSGRDSPTSDGEGSDPFLDPPSFQTGISPFAPVPISSEESEGVPTSSTMERRGGYRKVEINRTEVIRNRSNSGLISSPTTPRSEVPSDDVHKWIGEGSGPPAISIDTGKLSKSKRISTPNGSRMSMFFRGSSVGSRPTTPTTPSTPASLGAMGRDSWETGEGTGMGASVGMGGALEVRNKGRGGNMSTGGRSMDLLEDATVRDPRDRDSVWGSGSLGNHGIGFGRAHSLSAIPDGGDREDFMAQNIDLWEGVEFGRGTPKWIAPPQPGPFSNPSDWRDDITLYPLGSNPFFIRAPTWRSLLRFLASQSNTRIEPSVEALATSRTPTIDLRLVVQFARDPSAPKGTPRNICLYMCLHAEMPSLASKLGKTLMPDDRVKLETWNTRALPYGFMCQEGTLLSRTVKKSSTTLTRNLSSPAVKPLGTPLDEQDPDGEDSMFVTLPPPFIELPVNLSNIAMYLHECLVVSRRNGKAYQDGGARSQERISSGSSRIKKPTASSLTLPADITNGVPSNPVDLPQAQLGSQKHIPGIKRLAKAVKMFYPDEYAIGSSKANHAAELAAIEDSVGGKALNVPNSGNNGGVGKGGLFSAFQRVRSKSAVAKQAVGGGGSLLGGSRDANAERYELVTPWRQ